MREIRIACGQFVAAPGDKPANVAHMIAYAQEARDERCELILFPELIVTGYLAPERVRPLAEPLSGPSVRRLMDISREFRVPLAAGLMRSGAGIGTMVAFLTGWSLWAFSRLPMEVGILGWKLTLVRLASTFFLPPIAGLIAHGLFETAK